MITNGENPYNLPLNNKWKLYTSSKNKSKDKYTQCQLVPPFSEIDTVGKALEMTAYLGLTSETDPRFKFLHEEEYFFMRENIQPLWEDEANKKGGALSIKIEFNKSYKAWNNLIIYLISDYYDELKKINGIQFTLKKNPTHIQSNNSMDNHCAFIKIWDCDVENRPQLPKEVISYIEKEYRENFYTPFEKKEVFGKLPVVSGKYRKKINYY